MKLLLENWREYINEAKKKKKKKVYMEPHMHQDSGDDAAEETIEEQEKDDTKKVSKVMIIDNDKVLLLKRHKDSNWKPLYWDFPGGHIKDDETWEDGAKRETKEEIGLTIGNLEEIGTENNKMEVKFFKTDSYSGDIELDKSENEDYIWMNVKDVDIYSRITPNVKKMIKRELGDEDQ